MTTGGRQYKSRKARPCDFCRSRKVACRMEEGPPCELCTEKQAACTFVQAPGKRKRPSAIVNHDHAAPAAVRLRMDLAENSECLDASWMASWDSIDAATAEDPLQDIQQVIVAGGGGDGGGDCQDDDQGQCRDECEVEGDNRDRNPGEDVVHVARRPRLNSAPTPQQKAQHDSHSVVVSPARTRISHASHTDSPQQRSAPSVASPLACRTVASTGGYTLDGVPGVSYRAVGATGDLDLYVLSHRDYGENDESSVQYRGLRYRRMRPKMPISTDEAATGARAGLGVGGAHENAIQDPPPVFTLLDQDMTARAEPRLDKTIIEATEQDFASQVPPRLAYRLILLYAHFVHPYFPILSSRQFPQDASHVMSMPTALLAAICATAIPFIVYDDVLSVNIPDYPAEDDLFRIAWLLVLSELHACHLSTIQTCLLLLQRHDSNQRYIPTTPFKPALLSTTVSLCHCLSLHRDPSSWTSLPRWEKQLRKRIWWATWLMDQWISLGESLPLALNENDCDVRPLDDSDMRDPLPRHLESDDDTSSGPDQHFTHLVSLSDILAHVHREFFTVRASSRSSTNLEVSLETAKPLRARLRTWHDSLPAGLKRARTHMGSRQTNLMASFCRLNASGTFHLAYLTVQMTLLRALLRPVAAMAMAAAERVLDGDVEGNEDSDEAVEDDEGEGPPVSSDSAGDTIPDKQREAARAVITGAMTCVNDVVLFVESLDGSEWAAFWHSWSRTNLAITSSVMLNLLVILRPTASPTAAMADANTPSNNNTRPSTESFLHMQEEYLMLLDLLTRWRWAMKIASRGAGGSKGLMDLSLLRMDSLLSELTGPRNDS